MSFVCLYSCTSEGTKSGVGPVLTVPPYGGIKFLAAGH